MSRILNALMIIGMSIVASVVYGIIHDQITVRICPEYFTVFHPPIFGKQPLPLTELAIRWGIVATWWVGAILGCCLAFAACVGKAPMRSAATLLAPIGKLLVVMAMSALASGILGYWLVQSGNFQLDPMYASALPGSKHAPLVADAFAHNASYLVGMFGGCVIVMKCWRARKMT